MSANCDIIVIFWIYDQFGAIQLYDSGRIVCKTFIFISIILQKLKTELKISFTVLTTLL